MDCKKCGNSLPDDATYCGCGWRKLKPKFEGYQQDMDVPCAHAGCGIAAMCKVHIKTGWANFCWRHYDAYFSQQAIDNLDKYGMELQPDETKAEHVLRMRLFVREGIRRMAKSGGRQAALDAMAAVQARQP